MEHRVIPAVAMEQHIAVLGKTGRGHAVVMCYVGEGKFVLLHDPHPSRDGIVGEVEDWWWFTRMRR